MENDYLKAQFLDLTECIKNSSELISDDIEYHGSFDNMFVCKGNKSNFQTIAHFLATLMKNHYKIVYKKNVTIQDLAQDPIESQSVLIPLYNIESNLKFYLGKSLIERFSIDVLNINEAAVRRSLSSEEMSSKYIETYISEEHEKFKNKRYKLIPYGEFSIILIHDNCIWCFAID